MGADYNLYIKKDYPEPDKCIYGINICSCLSKSIIHLIFQEVSKCNWTYNEWGDPHLCALCRKDFIAIRELLPYDNDTSECQHEIALMQLDEIIDSCSDEDRLILEVC